MKETDNFTDVPPIRQLLLWGREKGDYEKMVQIMRLTNGRATVGAFWMIGWLRADKIEQNWTLLVSLYALVGS